MIIARSLLPRGARERERKRAEARERAVRSGGQRVSSMATFCTRKWESVYVCVCVWGGEKDEEVLDFACVWGSNVFFERYFGVSTFFLLRLLVKCILSMKFRKFKLN